MFISNNEFYPNRIPIILPTQQSTELQGASQPNNAEEYLAAIIEKQIITPNCRFNQLNFPSMMDLAEIQNMQSAIYHLMRQEFNITSLNGAFEISFNLYDLFTAIEVNCIEVTGSSKLWLCGQEYISAALAAQGLPHIFSKLSSLQTKRVFESNDIDLSCKVHLHPTIFTEKLVAFLATRLPSSYDDWPDSQKQQLIKLYIVTKRGKSKSSTPYQFAMHTVGNIDFFFYQEKLERTYLYFHDAWRIQCCLSNFGVAAAINGDFQNGWDSLLMQLFGILDTDHVETLNLRGVYSLFCQYGKGKRPLRATLEIEFLKRLCYFIQKKPLDFIVSKFYDTVCSRFGDTPGTSAICALNLAFMLEALNDQDLKNIISPLLLRLKPQSTGAPALQLIESLFHMSLVKEQLCIESSTLCAWLQVFARLLWSETKNSDQSTDVARAAREIDVTPRTYGTMPRFQISFAYQKSILELVIPDDLLTAIKNINLTADALKQETIELLRQLFAFFLPPKKEASMLFNAPLNITVEERSHPIGLETEIYTFMRSPIQQHREIAFLLLCYHGCCEFSAQTFSTLLQQLPTLLAAEKSPAMRQQCFSQFCAYVSRGSKMTMLAPYTNDFENFYVFLERKNATPQEILRTFAHTFSVVPFKNFTSIACEAWKQSCSYSTTLCDFEAGKVLLKNLPSVHHREFMQALKAILKETSEQYRRLSTLFFEMQVAQKDAATLNLISTTGQLLLSKAISNVQIDERGDITRYYELTQQLLSQSPSEGVALLYALEKRKLLTGRFKTIICDSTAVYAKTANAKAELLLLWNQQMLSYEEQELFHATRAEDAIDLLFEGYATSLSPELSHKLGTAISNLLIQCHNNKHTPKTKLIDKIALRRVWLLDTFISDNNNNEHYLMRAMISWGLPIALTKDQIAALKNQLPPQCALQADLVFDLLQMSEDTYTLNEMYEHLLTFYMESTNFMRADICIRKLVNSDSSCIDRVSSSIEKCILGLISLELPSKGNALFQMLLQAYSPMKMLNDHSLCRTLFISLLQYAPLEALRLLEQLPEIYKDDATGPEAIHQLIFKLLPLCVPEHSKKTLTHSSIKSAHKSRAKISRNHNAQKITRIYPPKELPPHKALMQKLIALITSHEIVHPRIFGKLLETLIVLNEIPIIEELTPRILKISSTSCWRENAYDAATCWHTLLLSLPVTSEIFFSLLSFPIMEVVSLVEENLPESWSQTCFYALALGLLSCVPQNHNSITQMLDTSALIMNKLKDSSNNHLEPLRVARMKACLFFPDIHLMLQFWNDAIQLALGYASTKEAGKIDDLQLLVEQSLHILNSQGMLEEVDILTKLGQYAVTLCHLQHKSLERLFHLLINCKTNKILPIAVQIAEVAFKGHTLESLSAKTVKTLTALAERCLKANEATLLFELLNPDSFPLRLAQQFRIRLLQMQLQSPETILCVNKIQQALRCYLICIDMLELEEKQTRDAIINMCVDLLISLVINHKSKELYNGFVLLIMEELVASWQGAEIAFTYALQCAENSFKALIERNAAGVVQNTEWFDNEFSYFQIQPRKMMTTSKQQFSLCKDRLCLFLGCLTSKICALKPINSQLESFVSIHTFVNICFLLVIDKSKTDLLINLLDDCSFRQQFLLRDNDSYRLDFCGIMKDTLFNSLIAANCFQDKNEQFYHHYLLSGCLEGIRVEITLPFETRAHIAADIIKRLCITNNPIHALSAIRLLKIHQAHAFINSKEILQECYVIIYSKLSSYTTFKYKGVSLSLLFTDAIVDVPTMLGYQLNYFVPMAPPMDL